MTLAGTLNVNDSSVAVTGAGLTLADGTINDGGRDLDFSGTQTLAAAPGDTGTVNMTSSNAALQVTNTSGLLTIAPGITINGGGLVNSGGGLINSGTANLDNQGTIDTTGSSSSGSGLTVTGNWSNDGLLESTSGTMTLSGTWTNNVDGSIEDIASTVNFSGTWNNEGTLTSSGAATVGLGGNFTLANLGRYTRDPGGADSYVIEGTLTLAGEAQSTLTSAPGNGPWAINGGTIVGGTVDTTLNTAGDLTGTLENVTLAGTLNVNEWSVAVAGAGLTLADGTINDGGRDLDFSGTQTLAAAPGDTGTVNMTSSNAALQVTNTSGLLTIDHGITISGSGGTITSGTANLDNQGVIDSNSPDTNLIITGNWTNNATIEALLRRHHRPRRLHHQFRHAERRHRVFLSESEC